MSGEKPFPHYDLHYCLNMTMTVKCHLGRFDSYYLVKCVTNILVLDIEPGYTYTYHSLNLPKF